MAFLQCIFYDGEPDHNHEKNICHNDCIDIASPKCVLSDLLPNYLSKHGTPHKIFVTMYALICFLPSVHYQVHYQNTHLDKAHLTMAALIGNLPNECSLVSY